MIETVIDYAIRSIKVIGLLLFFGSVVAYNAYDDQEIINRCLFLMACGVFMLLPLEVTFSTIAKGTDLDGKK